MVHFIIVGAIVALAGGAYGYRKTSNTLRSLCHRVEKAWTQLTSSLAHRHLVISHLVDAIAPSLGATAEISELSAACDLAQQCLLSIEGQSPDSANVNSVEESQRQLCEVLESVLSMIEADDDVQCLETVAGCLQGLDSVDERVRFARVAYNDAAVTHRTFMNTSIASLVSHTSCGQMDYGVIDWSPTHSSINQPMAPRRRRWSRKPPPNS